MVRLNLAAPFLAAVEATGSDPAPALAPHGLQVADFDNPDQFVTAFVMYDVVESLAALTGDPHCGVHLGETLDPFAWSPLAQAARSASTVGDLLLRFAIAAYKDATSVEFRLETHGLRSRFAEIRLADGGRQPRHNDGFGAAYILSVLRAAMGEHFKGEQVVASVCDPTVFPPGYLGIRVAGTDASGFSVSFPADWLLQAAQTPAMVSTGHASAAPPPAPDDTLGSLRYVLAQHLHESGLGSERVAQLCGVSQRTLVRRLADLGTSLKQELEQLKLERARSLLEADDASLAEVGLALGYTDPSVFSRSFKRWTGIPPGRYREQQSLEKQQ